MTSIYKHHSKNVAAYSMKIMKILRESETITFNNVPDFVLYKAFLYHDIGKSFIPLDILDKPAQLTDEEITVIQKHPILGAQLLKHLLDKDYPSMPQMYKTLIWDVANSHQEKADGTGYAQKIKGKQISLPARVCAIADTYDAIVADRPYRKGQTHQFAINVIESVSGTQLDAKLTKVLLRDQSWAC